MTYLTDDQISKIPKTEKTLVIHNKKVYDVSKFVNIHPGGKKILTLRHGKDVTDTMENGPHRHSKNAMKWLQQYYVADYAKDEKSINEEETLLNGQSNGVNGTVNGHVFTSKIYSKTKEEDLVNWNEPMLWQVGNLGSKYHDWVDDPVDKPLRLFKSDFIEFFSNTRWYVIPIVWLPIVMLFILHCYPQFQSSQVNIFTSIPFLTTTLPLLTMPFLFLLGMMSWTFMEYALHRWLFHSNPPTTSYSLITLHFLLHGQHHKVPFDSGRLVFPPPAAMVFMVLIYFIMSALMPSALVDILSAGLIFGYVGYDMIHYYLHYGSPSRGSYFDRLRAYHVRHHFESPEKGFGISSKLWDYPFNTIISLSHQGKDKKQKL